MNDGTSSGPDPLVCDVAGLPADILAVDALVRLELAARRLGRRIRLAGVPPELDALIELCGLRAVLAGTAGEPEEREEPGGVEEGVDRGDPPA